MSRETPGDVPPPPARGLRLDWSVIPGHIRSALEGWAGSGIVQVASQASGFSPGVAARLCFADGRRLFVKAVDSAANPDSPGIHRREARIVAALPAGVAVPRLVWSFDEGEPGWVVLAFDDIEGVHPAQPWRVDELGRVLAALAELAARLTPSPLAPPIVRLAADEVARQLCGWGRLLQLAPDRLDSLDAWSRRHLPALARLEARAPLAVDGETLLHFDVRADNVLLTPDRVWFVDWPHASVGAAWVDAAFFAPSVSMQGGPLPDEVLRLYPSRSAVDADALTAAVAAIAGYFTHHALQPPPPGLPTLRPFQAAQGAVARQWLAQLTGWR